MIIIIIIIIIVIIIIIIIIEHPKYYTDNKETWKDSMLARHKWTVLNIISTQYTSLSTSKYVSNYTKQFF